MKNKLTLALVSSLLTFGAVQAQITPILPPDYGVTGIRQDSGGDVLMTGGTGSPSLDAATPAFLYYGPIGSVPSTTGGVGLYTYTPNFGGGSITGGAQFYGPNTNLFDPSIGTGNIRAVGAYKATLSATYQLGMIYNGPLDGSGTWTSIQVPEAETSGPVGDTIPHSTMGNLVVGNFDLQSDQAAGSGFIYDLSNPGDPWSTVSIGTYSTTLYGIWQNGGSNSTKYTIVGGTSDLFNGGKGLVFNYDSATKITTDVVEFSFNNEPTLVTHFEGISAFEGGFSLTSTTVQGAGYAFLPVNGDGSFGTPEWTAVVNQIDPMAPTTGDTVIDNNVLGVYTTSGGVSSYIAAVPEPSSMALLGLSALAILGVFRFRRTA